MSFTPFSASLWKSSHPVYHVGRNCKIELSFWESLHIADVECFKCGTPASTKPRKRSGLRATIKRRATTVFTSKDICCCFLNWQDTASHPRCRKFQTFSISLLTTSSSTTITRETFIFQPQRLLLNRGSNA